MLTKITSSPTLRLLRPKQWIKNSFVFAPLIFSGEFLHLNSVIQTILVVILFCVASSATYIINDYKDIEKDKLHPLKKIRRPLASGELSVKKALYLLVTCYIILMSGFFLTSAAMVVICAYLLLNLAYTFYLKNVVVIDIFVIAFGFVLRVFAGATAISVPLSAWMFVTTLCLALYLAANKRKQEIVQSGVGARRVAKEYSVDLLDKYAQMSAVGALLFYSLFVITLHEDMIVTIPFVIFGIFRYWFMMEKFQSGESPTDALFQDVQLQLTILLWIAACSYSVANF